MATGHGCGSSSTNISVPAAGGSVPINPSSPSVVPSKANLPKNSRGMRSDVGWKYGIAIEGTTKIQCKFCQKTITGGVYRLKHHLDQTQKDVEACKAVPEDVNREMLEVVTGLQTNLIKKIKHQRGLFSIQ